jgi:hypothetical protein
VGFMMLDRLFSVKCFLIGHSIVCPLIYDFDLVGLFLLGKVFYRDYQDKWGLKTLNQKIKT